MEIFYVKGRSDKGELVMTMLVPVLTGILSFLIIKNHLGLSGYPLLSRAPFADVIFGALWAVSLVLMGMASYRAKLAAPASVAHMYYALQLMLVFFWSVAAFRLKLANASFIIIILYLLSAFSTLFEFDKADKAAARLMLPSIFLGVAIAAVSFYSLIN